jgi:hypothetical protein
MNTESKGVEFNVGVILSQETLSPGRSPLNEYWHREPGETSAEPPIVSLTGLTGQTPGSVADRDVLSDASRSDIPCQVPMMRHSRDYHSRLRTPGTKHTAILKGGSNCRFY